jgi:hypothetical protein
VTPPEKPGSTGQNPEREPERPSGVATDGQAKPVEQETGGTPGSNGEQGKPAGDPPTTRLTSDDLERGQGSPPPWQRGPSEAAKPAGPATPGQGIPTPPPQGQSSHGQQSPPGQAGQKTTPVGPTGAPGETTVQVERPVLTGAAAARLFSDAVPSASSVPGAGGQNRTTVHLDAGNPSTGPLRIGAGATPSALRRPGRGPRRANLQIKRFDPWSVLKLSLVLSVALFFVWLVAVGVLYAVLGGMGVWDKLNGISSDFLQLADDGGGSGTAEPLISAGRVFGIAAIIGAVNIVLFSALATVGAFIYNVSADLAGGLEVTLAERE